MENDEGTVQAIHNDEANDLLDVSAEQVRKLIDSNGDILAIYGG